MVVEAPRSPPSRSLAGLVVYYGLITEALLVAGRAPTSSPEPRQEAPRVAASRSPRPQSQSARSPLPQPRHRRADAENGVGAVMFSRSRLY